MSRSMQCQQAGPNTGNNWMMGFGMLQLGMTALPMLSMMGSPNMGMYY
jgi:hypothetical protein